MLAHLKYRLNKSPEEERKEARLWREVNEIDAICTKLALPYQTQQLSVRIYNRASEVREFEHETLRPVLIGVTIYCGCKLSRISRPISEICSNAKITISELRKGYQIFLNHWDFISGSTDHNTDKDGARRQREAEQEMEAKHSTSYHRHHLDNGRSTFCTRSTNSPTTLQRLLQMPTPPRQVKGAASVFNGVQNGIQKFGPNAFNGPQLSSSFGMAPKMMESFDRAYLYNQGIVCNIQNNIHSNTMKCGSNPSHQITSCNANHECQLRYGARPEEGAICLAKMYRNGMVPTVPKIQTITSGPVVTNPFKIPESHPLKRDLLTASHMIRDSISKNRTFSEPGCTTTESFVSNIIATERANIGLSQMDKVTNSHPHSERLMAAPKHIPVTTKSYPKRPLLWKRRSPFADDPWTGVSDAKLRAVQDELSEEPRTSPKPYDLRSETEAVTTFEKASTEESTSFSPSYSAENPKATTTETTKSAECTTTDVIQYVNYHAKLLYNPKPKIRLGTQMKLTADQVPWHVQNNFSDRIQGTVHSDYRVLSKDDDPFSTKSDEVTKDNEIDEEKDENNNCTESERLIVID